jgi:hypothetical protein
MQDQPNENRTLRSLMSHRVHLAEGMVDGRGSRFVELFYEGSEEDVRVIRNELYITLNRCLSKLDKTRLFQKKPKRLIEDFD